MILEKFALDYQVELIPVIRGDKMCECNGEDYYINKSYCWGKTICIGIYTDKELELISFFHELGHILDSIDWSRNASATTTYMSERMAWVIGLGVAKTYGITFSRKALRWAIAQLNTYKKER